MKIVLVGAGSLQFGLGALGDIFSSRILSGSEVILHDINAAAMEKIRLMAQETVDQHKLDFTVHAESDRKKAFQDTDYIISSIEVGDRFPLWDDDWKVPMQYGIHQVYGENGGPGGIFHALRIVPVILEIVKDAVDIAPNAWIFNYSNPMAAIVTTVKRVFPEARFVGMCHEIGWLSRWLPGMLQMDKDHLHFTAAGLNHFSCMMTLTDTRNGEDLYPKVLKNAHDFFLHAEGYSDKFDKYRETGEITDEEQFHKAGSNARGRYEWADRRLVKFMLEHYGLLPITTDSHFGEYLSWAWDVADHRGIVDFYDWYKAALTVAHKPEIKLETGERAVPIIESMLEDRGMEESAVNILNDGYIDDLPPWIAVEVPALIDKRGITGIRVPDIPKGFLALLRNYTGVYDLTAEAVIHQKKDLVIQALLANPVVHQSRGIRGMVDRMIDLQKKWLGYLR